MDPKSKGSDHEDTSPIKVKASLVLGMHRSGTSSLAGTLIRLGGGAPLNLMPPSQDNARGFYESDAIVALDDKILASAGSNWFDWRAFNPAWYDCPTASAFREEAIGTLVNEYGGTLLPVIKDPRICRLLPFWLPVLQEAGWSPHVFMSVRSPLEVAWSLNKRNGLSLNHGCLLWLRHVLEAEFKTRLLPRAIIEWNQFLSDWRLAVTRASKQVNFEWPHWSDYAFGDIDEFLSGDLRHHHASEKDLSLHPSVNDWAREAYSALVELVSDPESKSAQSTLDDVRESYDKAARIFGGALHESEQQIRRSQAQADSISDLNRTLTTERDNLLAQLRAVESALTEQDARCRALEDTLSSKTTEIEELSARTQQDIAKLEETLSSKTTEIQELSARAQQDIAKKDAELRECWHHVERMNASPWWQFGMWFTNLWKRLRRT